MLVQVRPGHDRLDLIMPGWPCNASLGQVKPG
jgi:hypothetical protein